MASQTPNLKLVKPAASEAVDISVLNGNSDKIDTAVKAVQDSISSHWGQGEVDCNELPTGIHYVFSASSNKPSSYGGMCVCVNMPSNAVQLYIENTSNLKTYARRRSGTSWESWKQIV